MKSAVRVIVVLLIVAAIVALQVFTSNGGDTNRVELNPDGSSARSDDGREREARIERKAIRYPRAVELQGIDSFLNVNDSFTLQEHVGEKVILIDFWTYSCINCQRTFPYLNAWWDEYEDDGLLIVGVHAPEFEFEKDVDNVQRAIDKYGLEYPVVLDNDHATWRAYNNRYWPRKYLIDIDGFIVYDHIGEGAYDESERMIRRALSERAKVLGLNGTLGEETNVSAQSTDFSRIKTRELYFGYAFERGQLGSPEGFRPQEVVNYTLPDEREASTFYLEGEWLNEYDYMESVGEASIALSYTAKQVNIVAGADEPKKVSIYVDGVLERTIEIENDELYTLVDADRYATRDLTLLVPPGVRVYTFTFG